MHCKIAILLSVIRYEMIIIVTVIIPAYYISSIHVPKVITDSPPYSIVQYLHSTLG